MSTGSAVVVERDRGTLISALQIQCGKLRCDSCPTQLLTRKHNKPSEVCHVATELESSLTNTSGHITASNISPSELYSIQQIPCPSCFQTQQAEERRAREERNKKREEEKKKRKEEVEAQIKREEATRKRYERV